MIYRRRGELEQAESMHRKSLAINEQLGHLDGQAAQYANLGVICETRGELDQARIFWTKSRDLFERLGASRQVQLLESLLAELPEKP